MESLLAYALLFSSGLAPSEEYGAILDAAFLREPESEILLELEWHSADLKDAVCRIRSYCIEHRDELDFMTLGRCLLSRLEALYRGGELDLKSFGAKTYRLWETLPPPLQGALPFSALCYADDPLSWGDEAQTREIYEKMFRFYDAQ